MKKLGTEELRAGMVAAADVKDAKGRLVLPKGATLTERHIAAFKTWGVTTVMIVGVDAPATPVASTNGKAPPQPVAKGGLDPEAAAAELSNLFRHANRDHPAVAELEQVLTLRRTKKPPIEQPPAAANALAPLDAAEVESLSHHVPAATDWVRALGTLPTLPDLFQRLTEIIDQPRSSAKDIAKVIERDAGLTARLLRLVNSALYAFSGKVDGIARALALVGTEEVKNLALATSVVSVFRKVPPTFITMRSFWSHSLATALAAREIGRIRRETNVETLFVGGLLHDTGAMVLVMHRAKQEL
jgi:hypothetical protein